MNLLLQWVAAPEWAHAVRALLHTLWQGALAALILATILRSTRDPAARYRCSLGALGALLFAGVLTWAVLATPIRRTPSEIAPAPATPTALSPSIESPALNTAAAPTSPRMETNWTAWLALAWMAGAGLMLLRAATQVAGAERLRRSSRPLEDSRVTALLHETRRALRLARAVRIAVTETMTSPAVVGVVAPTLILPLTLLTTLTQEQLRFVLIHELAHIRRGDYFANLFQLLVEALLFFNPAAWWISHQVRREREACCDAWAIELSGAPADYARTLLHVAENSIQPPPMAATAFGDRREPSSLAERVQRLLVPNYRPSLRLSWRAMLAALFVGGVLLFLSAAATRVTVSAILSPQERIDRIEKKLAQYGLPPKVDSPTSREQVLVSVRIRSSNGEPLPRKRDVFIHTSHQGGSGIYSARANEDGFASNRVNAGQIWLEANFEGYAPAVGERLDGTATNQIDAGELLIERGFDVRLRLADASSDAPVTNAFVRAQFLSRATGDILQRQYDKRSDSAGYVTLPSCLNHPLRLTVTTEGYQVLQQTFNDMTPDRTLTVKMTRGQGLKGIVVDKATGTGLSGATVRVIHEKGENEGHYQWSDPTRLLAETDANGQFEITQLRRTTRYWLGVSAPGHESVIIEAPWRDSDERVIKLGPELIVQGQVIGSIEGQQQINNDRVLRRSFSEETGNSSYGDGEWVPLRVTNGVVRFQFTNRVAGSVTLSGKGYHERRNLTGPINDWVVDLSKPLAGSAAYLEENSRKRDVVFRFTHSSGVPPRGTVAVTIPENLDPLNRTASIREMELTNGEVRVPIAVGGWTDVEPRRMVGYWFNPGSETHRDVIEGPGPLVVEVPLVPAGAIYARALNADGSDAGGLHFGVTEIQRAPGRGDTSLGSNGDSFSGNGPRKWASGPLPLGGTYEIYGWRGNSFATSKPIKLTAENPDAEVILQFTAAQGFEGVVLDSNGTPLRDTEVKLSFSRHDNHGFELKPVYTDKEGRFRVANMTPSLGKYVIEVNAPGMLARRMDLKVGSQPQTFKLEKGRVLAGRVVESATGRVIPRIEVRALDFETHKLPVQKTWTDDDGRFEFTSLGEVEYVLHVEDGHFDSQRRFRADGTTNLTLFVKLYEWSKAKLK